MKKRLILSFSLAGLLVIGLLAVSGVGVARAQNYGGSNSSSMNMNTQTNTNNSSQNLSAQSTNTGNQSNHVAVSISNFAFMPQNITINPGMTVTWTNNDSVTHTVTADNGMFNSGNLAPGQSFSFTFPSTGTFTYHCSIHPSMTGTVTVLAVPLPSSGGINPGVNNASNLPGLPITGASGNMTLYFSVLFGSAILLAAGLRMKLAKQSTK